MPISSKTLSQKKEKKYLNDMSFLIPRLAINFYRQTAGHLGNLLTMLNINLIPLGPCTRTIDFVDSSGQMRSTDSNPPLRLHIPYGHSKKPSKLNAEQIHCKMN